MTRAVLLAVVAALALAGGAAPAGGAGERGELRIRERHHDNGGVYVEGAQQFARIRREGGRKVAEFRMEGELAWFRLRPGFYRLSSWTRICSGTCSSLDPPSYRCAGTFRVRAGRFVTATVHTAVGERCRITNP